MLTRRIFLRRASAAAAVPLSSMIGACSRKMPQGSISDGEHRAAQTLQGKVASSDLGATLTHEHVCVDPTGKFGTRQEALDRAVEMLTRARSAGIDTIIDATTSDVDRDVELGLEASRISGMQIIASTGMRLYDQNVVAGKGVAELADFFISEIDAGIERSEVKAGVIKAASTGSDLTTSERIVLQAAAQAHKATGAPIHTHSNSRLLGAYEQANCLEGDGVEPRRVVIGHSNDTDDLTYLTALARRGYFLGMDHMFWGLAPTAQFSAIARGRVILDLLDAGHADRIVLSNDWVLGDESRDSVNPDGLLYTSHKTIPFLKENGASDSEIHSMTVDNPRNWLSVSA